MISVVIPAFNEEPRIPLTLPSLVSYLDSKKWQYECIVIDDGSTDGTAQSIESFNFPNVRILRHEVNKGKGAALRKGIQESQGNYIFLVDADFPYAPDFFEHAIQKFEAEDYHAAIGARNLDKSQTDPSFPKRRVVAGKLFSKIVALLLPLDIVDTQCGFKAFQARWLKNATLYSFQTDYTLDIELLLILQLWRSNIALLPVKLINHHGSKIDLIRDSLRMLWSLLSIHRRYRRGEYPSSPPEFPSTSVKCPVCSSDRSRHRGATGCSRFRTCKACGTIFQDPCISESSASELYSPDYYETDTVRSGYIDYLASPELQDATVDWIWAQLEPMDGGKLQRILDVGCGSGSFLRAGLARGKECWGNDILSSVSDPPYRFCQGDFLTLDLPSGYFDLIFFDDSFEHFHRPEALLQKCKCLLRKGGLLLINTPDPNSLIAGISGKRWISLKKEHLVLYPRDVLKDLLSKSSFQWVKRIASRQRVDWNYLEPRLLETFPFAHKIGASTFSTFAPRYFWVPTSGMMVFARLTD